MKAALPMLPLLLLATAVDARKTPPPPPPAPVPTSVDGLPIGAIPRQQLPPGSCAAFLWTQGPSHALVAMIGANPALIRYAPGGVVTDLARTGGAGEGKYGLSPQASFAGGDAAITADLTIEERGDIKDGAAIPVGTLSITRTGADTIVVPVSGLIGCG